jgi:hypothetical protein
MKYAMQADGVPCSVFRVLCFCLESISQIYKALRFKEINYVALRTSAAAGIVCSSVSRFQEQLLSSRVLLETAD